MWEIAAQRVWFICGFHCPRAIVANSSIRTFMRLTPSGLRPGSTDPRAKAAARPDWSKDLITNGATVCPAWSQKLSACDTSKIWNEDSGSSSKGITSCESNKSNKCSRHQRYKTQYQKIRPFLCGPTDIQKPANFWCKVESSTASGGVCRRDWGKGGSTPASAHRILRILHQAQTNLF